MRTYRVAATEAECYTSKAVPGYRGWRSRTGSAQEPGAAGSQLCPDPSWVRDQTPVKPGLAPVRLGQGPNSHRSWVGLHGSSAHAPAGMWAE